MPQTHRQPQRTPPRELRDAMLPGWPEPAAAPTGAPTPPFFAQPGHPLPLLTADEQAYLTEFLDSVDSGGALNPPAAAGAPVGVPPWPAAAPPAPTVDLAAALGPLGALGALSTLNALNPLGTLGSLTAPGPLASPAAETSPKPADPPQGHVFDSCTDQARRQAIKDGFRALALIVPGLQRDSGPAGDAGGRRRRRSASASATTLASESSGSGGPAGGNAAAGAPSKSTVLSKTVEYVQLVQQRNLKAASELHALVQAAAALPTALAPTAAGAQSALMDLCVQAALHEACLDTDEFLRTEFQPTFSLRDSFGQFPGDVLNPFVQHPSVASLVSGQSFDSGESAALPHVQLRHARGRRDGRAQVAS